MFEEDIAPRVCRQTDRALSTSEGPALDSETFGFLLCHPVTFTGEAKASPSKDSVCFLWELKSEAQMLNFTLIPSTFSSGPFRCHASVLSPSILGRGHSLHPGAAFCLRGVPWPFCHCTLWHRVLNGPCTRPSSPPVGAGLGAGG